MFEVFDVVGLPRKLRTKRNALCFFMLVQSHRIMNKRQIDSQYQAALQPYMPHIENVFFKVFNENNIQLRSSFFSDELV